jgi:ribosomal protein S2
LNKSENSSHKISKRLIELKKKIDLIVILDHELNNEILKESYIAKIPTITLNAELDIFNIESNYKVPGNFIHTKTAITNNFFYSVILATLKRSNKVRKKFPSIPYKLNTTSMFKKRPSNRFNKFRNQSKW